MIKKTKFAKQVRIGQNTLVKLSKNEFILMEVLDKIGKGLNCNIGDVVEIINKKKGKVL